MPKEPPPTVRTGTLLFVAIVGGIVALAFQPLITLFYAHLGLIKPDFYQQLPTIMSAEPQLTTTAAMPPSTTVAVQQTTSVPLVKNDLTIDEEPIILKNEPLTVELPISTTVKPPVVNKTSKGSQTKAKPVEMKKVKEPPERVSKPIEIKKDKQPELVDVTGRNKEVPDAVKNFKSTKISMIKPKKLWIPVPNSNGGHRRVPPIAVRAGKEHNSSVKMWLFEEFLSPQECANLIQVHREHVNKMKKIDPILCFDSIQTLRKHLKDLQPNTIIEVTPNDFTRGTTCINATFSFQLKQWGLKWSYSTAFYLGESPFSVQLSRRIEEATGMEQSHGGKFQITSSDKGIGYKAHRDCTLDGIKQDRYATFLTYLNTVNEGGETEFKELGIEIKPKEGRAIVWNNMNDEGKCEEKSIHSANDVGDDNGKYVLQRWYYYENFYSLGKRPPEPDEPERQSGQARVSCDEYDMGSCRAYDEWNFDHLIKYRNAHHHLF